MLFPSTSRNSQKRGQLLEAIGDIKYNCYILAEFNPIKARRIYMEARADEIAEAIVVKKGFYYQEERKHG